MAYLSEKLGFHIIELPIHFEDRRVGPEQNECVGQSGVSLARLGTAVAASQACVWRQRAADSASGSHEERPACSAPLDVAAPPGQRNAPAT